jgi:hypothetical protein
VVPRVVALLQVAVPGPAFVILSAAKNLVLQHPSGAFLLGRVAVYHKKRGTSRWRTRFFAALRMTKMGLGFRCRAERYTEHGIVWRVAAWHEWALFIMCFTYSFAGGQLQAL